MHDTLKTQLPRQHIVPLLIVEVDGTITQANATANDLFGYTDCGLAGRSLFEILAVRSMAGLLQVTEFPASETLVHGVVGQARNGSPILLDIHVLQFSDPEPTSRYALTLHEADADPISDQVFRNEQSLSRNAIEGANIGVFEYNPLTDTVIVSDIWRKLLELEDDDTRDVQETWRARVHPDDLETALEPVRLCLEDLEERPICEYRLRSADGSHWRWMQTNVAVARRDKGGRPIRLIGAMTEITERKTTEEALRRSVEQFRSTFDNAPIGKAIVSLDGIWLSVNPALCSLLGYSESDLLGTNFQAVTHPDDMNNDLPQFDLLKAGEIPGYQIEKRYVRADGDIIWGLLSVGMVRDARGAPDHCISQIVDITEQQRLQELKTQFVATVSHELRSPLTSVLGSVSLLSTLEHEVLSEDGKRLLRIAQENGRRLHALINDILDFEKISAHRMTFIRSHLLLCDLVDQAIFANAPMAEKFAVRFEVDCPDASLTGFVDPKRFHQVMTNLLTNAAKFADPDSVVRILVEDQKETVLVSITNEGEGIPSEFRSRMFMPFSQADTSLARKRDGTGLGLNIAKQIVEQSGGEIGFDSAESGRTTFWFTVPTTGSDQGGRNG